MTLKRFPAGSHRGVGRFRPPAYERDPLAEGTLLTEDFYRLGQSLRQLEVPMFSLLEGGVQSGICRNW